MSRAALTRAALTLAALRRRVGEEHGTTPVELVLGLAVLLLPATFVVALLPTWSERQAMAVVAATEAARAAVLADDWATGHAAGLAAVERTAGNHGLSGAVEGVVITGDLSRGGTVTAAVTVRIPLSSVPFAGDAGGWSWRASHSEPVDRYRSFP